MLDSSATARTTACAGGSPGSTLPPNPTIFLVVRHSYSDPSRWGLPGGGYKPNVETPEQAISREVAEELSVSLPATAFIALDTVTTTLEGKRDTLTILRAVSSEEQVSLSPELA